MEEGTCALECPGATTQKILTVVTEAKICELLNL